MSDQTNTKAYKRLLKERDKIIKWLSRNPQNQLLIIRLGKVEDQITDMESDNEDTEIIV